MKRLMLLVLMLTIPVIAHAAASRTLTMAIPAAGINSLAITVGVGELHIAPSSDDSVHVQVDLEQKSHGFLWFFHWQSGVDNKDIQAAQISHEQQGQRLMLSLDIPGKSNDDDVKQKWIVQVPARLAVNLTMKVGQASINGVAGGVQADLDVGELDMDVPQGALSANINVGQIRATSGTAHPGTVTLSSNIGDASLYMDGKHISRDAEHSGLGRSISVAGNGPDSMRLSVNIGEVDLRIESSAQVKNKS